MSNYEKVIEKLAKNLVSVERDAFYGDEPAAQRLKKMRELISNACEEIEDDH